MPDPKPRPSLRIDALAAALAQKLENEAGILDLLVAALARGQTNEALWNELHAAAQRDDRLAELAFAYERLSRDKKLKSLTPAAQAAVLGHAGAFFAEVFGDADGAEGYLERALALAPGDVAAFEMYAKLLQEKKDLRRLGELYAAAAPTRGDKAEQLRLLRRGAELCEADAERALRLNQEILRLDPADARAKKALAALFEKTGRLADLAKVLEQSLAQDGAGEGEARAIRVRLLTLYTGGLGEVERAVPHVEEILRAEPTHEQARKIAEELLARKPLTARVADALARAFEDAGEPAEAVRMLGIAAEALRGPKKLEVQKRLSAITLTQLGDLEKAFSIDEQIVPLDPGDDDVRARFVQLASALDKQLDATRALGRAATAAKDPATRARISADLGDLYREGGDAKKARASYQAALDAGADDEASLRSARALAALCADPRDPKALAVVLAKLAEIEPEEEAKVAATRGLATIAEEEIGDRAAAIAAWEKLAGTKLEGEALAALARLYEAAGQLQALAGVLDRMAAREPSPGKAREIAFRAADLRSSKLPDRAAALEAWRAYTKRYGASREALARLVPLLEHERRWEDLAAALSEEAALTPKGERAAVLSRLGQLRLGRLGDARGALEAHRQALAIDPAERQSRAAVERMLSAGELRLAAADVLEPIARAEGAPPALVRVLEARASLTDDPDVRRAALAEAAELSHAGLRDARRAVDLAARGLAEAIASDLAEVPSWIERIERMSAGAGDAARRAAALKEALGDRPVDSPELSYLARRAGEALVACGDVAGALAVLRRALAFEPSSADLLGRVDTLLRDQGSPEERIALYRAALDQASDPERRRELLHAIGALERRDLNAPAAAISTYRQALAMDPEDEIAQGALFEILEGLGAWEDLYGEIERAAQRARPGDRFPLVVRLAELGEARGWIARAAAHYAEIVAAESGVTEELLAAAERVARAHDDTALLAAVIQRRVDGAEVPEEEATWLERLGELMQGRMGDAAAAGEAFRRAAVAAEMAGDEARAARLYDRVLASIPGDRAAAERLLAVHTAAQAWEKLPAVYAILLAGAPDAVEATQVLLAFEGPALEAGAGDRFVAEADALLGRADEIGRDRVRAIRAARARVLAEDPRRFEETAAAYRAMLEEGDDDGAMGRAFDAFLSRRGAESSAERRWLFAHRADRAEGADRAAVLLAWAAAEEASLGDARAAADLYARALDLDPENDGALAARARLSLAQGDFTAAAQAIERRRALAEGAARAALDLELATLLLDRLDRAPEALAVIAPVLEASPDNAAALALVERALGRPSAKRQAADLIERAADAAESAEAAAALMDLLLATPAGDPELGDARRGWYERLLDRPGLDPARALAIALRAAAEMPQDPAAWERAEHLARAAGAPGATAYPAQVAAAYRRALGVAAVRSPGAPRPLPEPDVPEVQGPPSPALVAGGPDTIEEIGRRAVEYHEEWFDEPETVVALLRRVIDLCPRSAWAFERAKLFYNLSERYDDLFSLYDAAIDHAEDPHERRELLEDAALAAKDLAADAGRAARYYEMILAAGPDARVRAALERIYERQGKHRPLVDLLAAELPSLEGEAAQKLRARIAQIWLDGIGEAEPAVRMAEEMLEADPERADAFELLERVMQQTVAAPPEAREARRRAAARLKDRYRAAGRAVDLVRVLEIELDAAKTPADRAERLRTIVRLKLDSLHDEAGAFEGLAALVTLEPSAADHRAELGRLAHKLGRPARLAEVLAAAAAAAEGTTKIELYAEAAAAYENDLGEPARAIALYRAILAASPDPERELGAARRLERLLDAEGSVPERCEVLERLAALEPEAPARRAARAELWYLSSLAGDTDRAVRAFRAALDEDPGDTEAEEGLARALEEAGRFADLVEVLERRAARGDDAKARADRVRVARIVGEELGDRPRAITAWNEIRKVFGPDDESTDALASLLDAEGRHGDLVALLEADATATADDARAAALWCRIGDVHRARTAKLDEAVAAYDLAIEQRPGEPDARRGLEAVVAAIGVGKDGVLDEAARRTLVAAVGSLSRLYAAADDFEGAAALLEPRLAAAASDADRVAVLRETAGVLEHRKGDVGGAFDAVFRAFLLAPSEALAASAARLADAADRWDAVAAALAGGLDARADVPASALRELWWRVAIWQRDRRGDAAAAEAAIERALARDPASVPLLSALADVQRRAPGRALVTTLLRLAELSDDPKATLSLYREAAEVAEGPVGDAALAKTLAEKLLDAAAARWGEGAAEAASWALEALVRLARGEGPAAMADLYLRGARLPFDAGERRRLRLRAAELGDGDATLGIYQELFEEDPSDPVVSERLDAIYRDRGERPALVALRERQIAVAQTPERRAALRLDLANVLAEGGEKDRAAAVLRETLAAGPHAPSAARLAELYEAAGQHADLVALLETRAAEAEAAGDAGDAIELWARAAGIAEAHLADPGRAVALHRRAASLGSAPAEIALARLLLARGDHAAAAEALEKICDRAAPDAVAEPTLRLVDAYLAAGRPSMARARLERAVRASPPEATALRERLASLYREIRDHGALAALIAEDAARAPDRAVRAQKLREAAELYLDRQGDPAAAVPLLEQAVEIAPEDVALRLKLASARRGAGSLDQAADTLREMLAAYGARRPKERAVVHHELALVTLARGDKKGALAELDAALRIDPAHPEVLHALARLSFEEGQLERAGRTYRALLLVVRRPRGEDGAWASGPTRAEVLFDLSEIARLRGETDRAAEQLESAFEAARESELDRERLVSLLRARGRHDVLARALEERLRAGATGEEAAALHEELAGLYEAHLGRPADALTARLAALALAPPSIEALERAQDLARRAGELPRFTAALSGLVDRAPSAAATLDLLIVLGRALERDAGDDAGAAAAYVRAEAIAEKIGGGDARLAEVRRALSGVYQRTGDAAAEEALLERRIGAWDAGGEAADLADALFRLASLRLLRPATVAGGVELLLRAFDVDPQADRAEAALRAALQEGADRAVVGRAMEHLARVTGRDRTLVDALVLQEGAAHEPLREAVEIAERIGDHGLAEDLLRRVIARAPAEGDEPIAWALGALADHRAKAGDLAEAADLRERAARANPEKERALLLLCAETAAGPLADLPRAARLYEELRAREPAEREIWQPLAEVYRRMGDRARLAALLEETAPLLEGAAERGRLRLERARMAIEGDQDKAVTLLKEVIEENPAEAEAAALLGDLLERLGRRDELAELVTRQIDAAKDREDRPAIVALSLRLGGLLEQQWDEQGALDVYHAALDWDPKNREVLRQIVRLGMARDDSLALGDALDSLLAVEEGEDAAKLAKKLADLRGAHGDAEGAEQALEQGWAACPGDASLREELVRRYTERGAWQKLADLHVRDAEARPGRDEKIELYCRAAELLRDHARDARGAAALLSRAFDLDPGNRAVLLALIDAYGAAAEHAHAVGAIDRALAVDARDPWLYRARASLHEALGRDQAALLDLEQAYEKSGGGYASELCAALAKAAAACAARGTPDARATERGLRLRLAGVLARAGDTERARAELSELTRTDGRDRAALHALAALEEGDQRWDAASAIYRRLIALEDGEALVDTALKLASTCEAADRIVDARGALERAIRVMPDHPGVRARLRAVYNVAGAGRELAALLIDDAARAPDPAARFPLLVQAGRLLLESEGEAPRAAMVLADARALRPDDAEVTMLLADAYGAAGRGAEARGILEAVVAAYKGRRAKPLASVHRRLARLAFVAGDHAGALAALGRAFDNDPQNAQLAMELGALAIELEDHDVATRAYRAVTLMKITAGGVEGGATTQVRAVAYYHLGRMAFLQGDRRKARLMIDKAVVDDPTLEAARALLDQLRS